MENKNSNQENKDTATTINPILQDLKDKIAIETAKRELAQLTNPELQQLNDQLAIETAKSQVAQLDAPELQQLKDQLAIETAKSQVAQLANPELQQLKDQLAIETAKRGIAEFTANEQLSLVKSQSDAIAGILPKTDIKAPEGTVTFEGEKLGFINEQLAYFGLKRASNNIKDLVKKNLDPKSKILIIDQLTSATEDLVYVEVQTQFDLYTKLLGDHKKLLGDHINQFEELIGEQFFFGPLLALAIAPAILGSIANIASYFKTDYTIKGFGLELKNEGLISTVAGDLADSKHQVYIYNNYLLDQTSPQETSLLFKLQQVHEAVTELSTKKIELAKQIRTMDKDLSANNERIQTLETKKKEYSKDLEKYRQEIEKIDNEISSIKEETKMVKKEKWVYDANIAIQAADVILASVETFLKGIATPESPQVYSKISRALLREKIRNMAITHLLYLNIISSGGEAISEKNLWKSKFAYVSGTVANCILTKTNGLVVVADFVPILNRCSVDLSGNNESSISPIDFTHRQLKKG